jgi:hypothetical protein
MILINRIHNIWTSSWNSRKAIGYLKKTRPRKLKRPKIDWEIFKSIYSIDGQSLIKKLDKVERIEVDEDDNSVMNISFPVSKEPRVVIEAEM